MASSVGVLASPNPDSNIPFTDSCFTEAEKQVLWIVLGELKGISAAWDVREASACQARVQKVLLSEGRLQYKINMSSDSGDASTRHGTSHGSSHGSDESSRRHGSSNGLGSNNGSSNGRHGSSNGSNNGSNNGSDDNSRRRTSNGRHGSSNGSNDGSNNGSEDNSRRHTSNDSNDKSGDDSNEKSGDDFKSGDEGSNPGSSGQDSEDPIAPSAGQTVPSEGSLLHQLGTCRPCIYACKNKCQAGPQCSFCHYPHEMPKRPGKNARRRAMRRITRGAEEEDDDEDNDVLTNSPKYV